MPLRVALLPIAPTIACDERDPAPNAMPTTPPPAAFTQIDAKIRQTQDAPSKYVYAGNVVDVLGDGKGKKGAFTLDAEDAWAFARRLEKEVIEKDDSPEWSVVALTREAEMFERLRDAFANLAVHRGPGPVPSGMIALLTPQQQQLLAALQARNPGYPTTQLQDAVLEFWNEKKQQELDALDGHILTAYARAAMSVQTKNPAAIRAVRRLAHYTRQLGNAKMAKLLGRGYVADGYLHACAALREAEAP